MRIRVLTHLLLLAALVASAGALAPAAYAKRSHHHHRRHHHRVSLSPHATPAAAPTPAGSCANADVAPAADNLAAMQDATLCLINQERTTRGLAALHTNSALTDAALGHSLDMVRNHYFDHTAPGGSTLLDRILKTGYVNLKAAWTLGENIAWGTGPAATPSKIVDAWMHSPEHRANILRPGFRDSGIGIAVGSPTATGGGQAGATYTQDFGTN